MNTRLPAVRTWFLAVLLGLVVVVPFAAERVSASASGPDVAVFGDSITARYNNRVGDERQGWWSIVGHHYHVSMFTYAQSGSGFQRPGERCTGTVFAARLKSLKAHPPKAVFVEGGRNDWAYCGKNGFRIASDARITRGVNSFFTRLDQLVPAGVKIYVLGPVWGPRNADQRDRVTRIVKASALAHRMTFIDTSGVFTPSRVIDGIHPNRAGSVALGDRVIAAVGTSLLPGRTS